MSVKIEVDKIEIPRFLKVREKSRNYLAKSLKKVGRIVQIPVVAKIGDKYLLVDGIGRFLELKKQGAREVEVRVLSECRDEVEASLLAVELNTAVMPLSFRDLVEISRHLLETLSVDEAKKKLREKTSISRTKMLRIFTLLELPRKLQELFFKYNLPENILDIIHKHREELSEEDIEYIFTRLRSASNKMYTCRKLVEQILEAKAIEEAPIEKSPSEVVKTSQSNVVDEVKIPVSKQQISIQDVMDEIVSRDQMETSEEPIKIVERLTRYVCFKCGEIFDPSKTERCEECTWLKCPECNACLCSLSPSEQFVAIAVWLSNVYVNDETWDYWMNYLRNLRRNHDVVTS